MNYLELINDFWKVHKQEHFTASEGMLYLYLLSVCNNLFWKNPFNISNMTIAGDIGISEKTLISARDKLKAVGFIDFNKGNGRGKNTNYFIKAEVNTEIKGGLNYSVYDKGDIHSEKAEVNTEINTEVKAVKCTDYIKQNNKLKQENKYVDKSTMSQCLKPWNSLKPFPVNYYKEFMELFFKLCPSYYTEKKFWTTGKKRKERIRKTLPSLGKTPKESLENAKIMFEKFENSTYCKENHFGPGKSLDWLLKQCNGLSVFEGNYDDNLMNK